MDVLFYEVIQDNNFIHCVSKLHLIKISAKWKRFTVYGLIYSLSSMEFNIPIV